MPGLCRHPVRIAHTARGEINNSKGQRVLGDQKSSLRPHLIWKNLYYGKRHRKRLDSFTFRSTSVNSVHFL